MSYQIHYLRRTACDEGFRVFEVPVRSIEAGRRSGFLAARNGTAPLLYPERDYWTARRCADWINETRARHSLPGKCFAVFTP